MASESCVHVVRTAFSSAQHAEKQHQPGATLKKSGLRGERRGRGRHNAVEGMSVEGVLVNRQVVREYPPDAR